MKGRKTRKELRRRARQLRTVSILFVAVKGFDRLYQMANPGPLVDQLDELNLRLDDIAFMYNVVKLKSVGDVMLFAAGLQGENRTNPIDMVRVGLDMQAAAQEVHGGDGREIGRASCRER